MRSTNEMNAIPPFPLLWPRSLFGCGLVAGELLKRKDDHTCGPQAHEKKKTGSKLIFVADEILYIL